MSELAVILGDTVAGTLTRLSGGRLRFDYAEDYPARERRCWPPRSARTAPVPCASRNRTSEHLCLDAARRAGLTAARTAVARFDDETAVVVTRYDRVERDGSIVRVHQEDLCQALSVPPDRKHENEGGPGIERIGALLRDAMPARASERAVRRFADALIWNWVRLAPLYEVASALPSGSARTPAPVSHEARR